MEERIVALLEEILYELKSQRVSAGNSNEEWLNASAFCRKFGISRPTLSKRIEAGLVEVGNFDDKFPRYRWKRDEKV